jgi:hypothetical protein
VVSTTDLTSSLEDSLTDLPNELNAEIEEVVRGSRHQLLSGTIGLRGVLDGLGRGLVMRLSKSHQGQHLDQGAKRQVRYRGYDILMRRRDLCWMVTMKPSRPELPEFQRYSFQTTTQSEREALAEAKRRVDHALETSRLTYSATRH